MTPGRHQDPSTRQMLQRLELLVTRRVSGIVHGDYQGVFPGPGSEIGDGRAYVPGDDVRLIDWNLTARTSQLHVRDQIRDHELDAWLVVDVTASQGLGTRGGRKRDLALFAAAAFGFAASRTANRLGAVLVLDHGTRLIPPRPGRAHLLSVLHQIAQAPTTAAGRTDLRPALKHTAGYATRRGFVAVVSDFLVQPDWTIDLHRLCQRHTVIAVEVVDPLDQDLPAIGRIVVEDPETGAMLHVDTSSPRLRSRYRDAAAASRQQLASTMIHIGAEHLPLHTEQDWAGQIVRYFEQRRTRLRQYRRTPWQG